MPRPKRRRIQKPTGDTDLPMDMCFVDVKNEEFDDDSGTGSEDDDLGEPGDFGNPFEDHLKDLTSTFDKHPVHIEVQKELLRVLKKFDPRYPRSLPSASGKAKSTNGKDNSLVLNPTKSTNREHVPMDKEVIAQVMDYCFTKSPTFLKLTSDVDLLNNSLNNVQRSVEEIQKLLTADGTKSNSNNDNIDNYDLLLFPLEPKDVLKLERADVSPALMSYYEMVVERKKLRAKLADIFTDASLLMYNWSGKSGSDGEKLAANTSKVFRPIIGKWFNGDSVAAKEYLLKEYAKLFHRRTKIKKKITPETENASD